MAIAIDLDHQFLGVAHKVHHMGADRRLFAEMIAACTECMDQLPEGRFGDGRRLS